MTDQDAEYLTVQQVAEFIGRSPRTVEHALYTGAMPEPDMVIFRRNLWLKETIIKWRKGTRKYRKGMPRRTKYRTPKSEKLPRNVKVAGASKNGKGEQRILAELDADAAKKIAAALRSEGHHATIRDVQQLAVADPETLDYDRRKLQQRVLRKVRGMQSRGT